MKCLFRNIQKQKNILKISLLFKKNSNFTGKYLQVTRINDAKFLGYFFYMNLNIQWNFQICTSVPSSQTLRAKFVEREIFWWRWKQ